MGYAAQTVQQVTSPMARPTDGYARYGDTDGLVPDKAA